MDSTQAIREAITFIRCSIEHAQECDLENTDDESLHCAFEGIQDMQEVITQLQRLPQASGSNAGECLEYFRPKFSTRGINMPEITAQERADAMHREAEKTNAYSDVVSYSESLSIVAAGYEIECSCGHEFEELYNERHLLQLTNLPRNERGEWVLSCPNCNTFHIFDGNEVGNAYD
tara:strand:+ start:87 stop:614 length:528 start_codon:yes stop_codon:yes gene_type:complete